MRPLTSLPELSARQIGELYGLRWQIELFFCGFKLHANDTRLISHPQSGAAWAFYVAIIGVTLMTLATGRPPSVYDLSRLARVAAGGATLNNLVPIHLRRHRSSERARRSGAKRRKRLADARALPRRRDSAMTASEKIAAVDAAPSVRFAPSGSSVKRTQQYKKSRSRRQGESGRHLFAGQ